MLAEAGYSWRSRSLGIALVYLSYFVAVIVSLVVASNNKDAVRPGLIVLIVVASLHFALGLYAMFVEQRRVVLASDVQKLVELGDWLSAAALGLATGAVNRTHGDNYPTLLVAGILLCLTQTVCAYKTFFFVNENYYDQQTGERV